MMMMMMIDDDDDDDDADMFYDDERANWLHVGFMVIKDHKLLVSLHAQ